MTNPKELVKHTETSPGTFLFPPMILQRPAGVCLYGKPGKCDGNTDSDTLNIEFSHQCFTKNTHKHGTYSFNIPWKSFFSSTRTGGSKVHLNRYGLNSTQIASEYKHLQHLNKSIHFEMFALLVLFVCLPVSILASAVEDIMFKFCVMAESRHIAGYSI